MSLCSVERDLKMGHGDLYVSRHLELGSIERIPLVSLDFALSDSASITKRGDPPGHSLLDVGLP